jgi:hypothetical protein
MTMRTTKGTVTWVQSPRLGEFGEQLPAGHPAETDGELEGMSFPAYQRTTMMHFMLDPQRERVAEIATVDPLQLEEALTMDGLEPPASNIDPPKIEP